MKVLESHMKTIEYSQLFSGDISLPIALYYAVEDDDLLEIKLETLQFLGAI